MRTLSVLAAAMLLSACAELPPFTGDKGLNLNPYIVDINWSTTNPCKVESVSEDTTVCSGGESDFCVGRNDFVIWQSNNPSDAQFEIFFDPIDGPAFQAGGNGWVAKKIDKDAPIGLYKYSIVRKGCPPNQDNTFDPHIRIDQQ